MLKKQSMETVTTPEGTPQKGNILIINTGSTTTKLGYFSDGERIFDTKLEHTADEVARYPSGTSPTCVARR